MKIDERFGKYIKKLRNFDAERKRRAPTALQGVQNVFGHYTAFASVLETNSSAKAHMLGMRGALSNISKSSSALGLFSDAFETNAQRLAEAMVKSLSQNPVEVMQELLTGWIELSVIAAVGLVELGKRYEAHKKMEGEINQRFKDELLLSLLFSSSYLQIFFQTLAEGIEVKKQEQKLFIAIMEFLTLFATLLASSTEEEWVSADLITQFTPYLLKDLEEITQALDRYTENIPVRALLEQLKRTLEKADSDAFIQAGIDLLESYGYSRIHLQSDLKEMKNLMNNFKTAYQASKDYTANLTHLVG